MSRSFIDIKQIDFLRSEAKKKKHQYKNQRNEFFNPNKSKDWNEQILHSLFLEYAVSEAHLQERSFQFSHQYTSDLSRKKESIERRALRMEARLIQSEIRHMKANYDTNIYAYYYMQILGEHYRKVREHLSDIGYKRDRRGKQRYKKLKDQSHNIYNAYNPDQAA